MLEALIKKLPLKMDWRDRITSRLSTDRSHALQGVGRLEPAAVIEIIMEALINGAVRRGFEWVPSTPTVGRAESSAPAERAALEVAPPSRPERPFGSR